MYSGLIAMNLRQLRYFAAAVEQGSVTRAAERLHVAQPALGQHIRALEAELNVSLLERHSRGVIPTPAGELLYTRCGEIFELLEKTQRDVTAFGHTSIPSITIGLTPSLTLLIGTDLQLAYAEHAPGAMLRVWEEPSFRLAAAVEQGELDIALAYDIIPRSSLALTPVMDEEMLFACRPNIAPDRSTVDLSYILAQEIALGSTQDIGRRTLARALGRPPEDVPVRYELQSIAGIREHLLRGTAVSVLPYGSIAHEIKAGRLVGLRIDGAPMKSTLYIVTRSDKEGHALLQAPRHAWLIEQAIHMAAQRQPLLATRLRA
jgi:LysR family nitrogen assimilation transcriptional regulator